MTTTRNLLTTLALLTAAATGLAQQIGSNKNADGTSTYTLSVKSQLVVESVTVKDKQGKFIPGLTAKDFVLTEDGAAQVIRFCEHQDLATNSDPLPASKSDDEQITLYKRLTRTSIAPEVIGAGADRYKNHRLLAMYFDMTAMRPADQLRALTAAETFLRTQMTSADLVAILRYQGGAVDILQDFSADRNKLLSILTTMIVGEGQGSADSIDDASSADTGAAFGQDDSEFNVFNTDRQLSALETAAKMLGQLNEKKVPHLLRQRPPPQRHRQPGPAPRHGRHRHQVRRLLLARSTRAASSRWPRSATPPRAPPATPACTPEPPPRPPPPGLPAVAGHPLRPRRRHRRQGPASTTNDLTRGIVQAQQSISDYYHPRLLHHQHGLRTAASASRSRSALPNNETALLDYRKGYYADKQFSKFTTVDKERQLEDALMLDDPITELTIAMEIDYFQLNRAEYFVPIVVKIPGRELSPGQAWRSRAHPHRLRRRDQGRSSAARPSPTCATTSTSSSPTRPPPTWRIAPSSTTPASRSCPAST